MNDLMDIVVKKAAQANPEAPGDYRGEGGLLYCGKCRTRKEWRNPTDGRIFPVMCECASEARRQENAQKAIKDRFSRSQCLPAYDLHDRTISDYTFEHHDGTNAKAKAVAEQYVARWDEVRKRGGGLMLWGDVGTGKTFTAGCIANALMDQYVPVLVTSVTKILNALTGVSVDKNSLLDSLRYYDLLVLDDFGAERRSDYALEQITRIVEDRTRANLPLIISTNLTPAQLKNPDNMELRRIYDRIIGHCVPVRFEGESKRVQEGAERIAWLRGLLDVSEGSK